MIKDERLTDFEFAKLVDFDDHISKSIRGYDDLCDTVIKMSSYFVENHTNVYDLGCSSGKLIARMAEHNNSIQHANYYGIDLQQDFIEKFQARPRVNLVMNDISTYAYSNTSFATSIFTLQFTPLKQRHDIVKKVYDSMNVGGAFVISEKTISSDPKIQDMMNSLFYQYKRNHFTAEEIYDKEINLRKMMKPSTDEFLYDILQGTGFRSIQKFWQSFNFVGYVCIK